MLSISQNQNGQQEIQQTQLLLQQNQQQQSHIETDLEDGVQKHSPSRMEIEYDETQQTEQNRMQSRIEKEDTD